LFTQFEKILAVSSGALWRQNSLQRAAQYTSLVVDIPKQPLKWPSESFKMIQKVNHENSQIWPEYGAANAWLGHLYVLQEVVRNGWSSALIIEDDADWDIAIKDQLSLVAPIIRSLTNSTDDPSIWPYGKHWDVLWLGHDGDDIPTTVPAVADLTLPPTTQHREHNGAYSDFPLYIRMVHKSINPIGLFAYAVNIGTISKLIALLGEGGEWGIDIKLRLLCQQELRCITVNPELFHHHQEKGQVLSEIGLKEGLVDAEMGEAQDFTANIRYSARCSSKVNTPTNCWQEVE
jgi:hypothetical protein